MEANRVDLSELLVNAFWLMPLARALARDSSSADDLVQDTWVAAAENPPRSREASRTWLRTVLRNRAFRKQREAHRRAQREKVVARPEGAPSEAQLVERMELQQKVAEVVLQLPTPYREVILLRYYADLGPAEIAKKQRVSVNTVGTRLRRGLDRLRKQLDASFGDRDSWCLALAPLLVGRTAKEPLTLGVGKTAVLWGVGMSSKKMLAVIVVLAVISATLIVGTRSDHTEVAQRSRNADQASGSDSPRSTQPEEDTTSSAETNPTPRGHEPELAEDTTKELLRGFVRAGNDHEPVSDASIRLFRPRRATIHELMREPDSEIRQNQSGQIGRRPWIKLGERMSTEQKLGLDPLTVYDTFEPSRDEFSRAISKSDGSFQIPYPEGGGVVEVSAQGYGTSRLIVLRSDEQVVLDLWQVGRLSGSVFDPEGNRVLQPLELLFCGEGAKPVMVESDETGAFSVEVAAQSVRATCLTPGWTLTNSGIHPERGVRWVFRGSFSPTSKEEAILIAQRLPLLEVSDEAGAAVDDFRLLVQRVPQGQIHARGRFVAPDGQLTLDPPSRTSRTSSRTSGGRVVLKVWAEGFAPHESELPEFPWKGVLEVVLLKGQVPRVVGAVRSGTGAVTDARVSLAAYREIAWKEQEGAVVALTKTDQRGEFELQAPAGDYLLQVQRADDTIYRVVSAPSLQTVHVDFSMSATISVSVQDTKGSPLPDHAVGLTSHDGRSTRRYTDLRGNARFEYLSPGEYTVFAPYVSTKDSFSGDVTKKLEVLSEGVEVAVVLEIPVRDEPIYPRVLLDPRVDLTDWKARDAKWPDHHVDLESDGSVPIDVQLGVRSFEVEDPSGRRWDIQLPPTTPRPYEIPIPVDGVRYRGLLLESGNPKGGVRVLAIPRAEGQEYLLQPSVVTNERGEFEIVCASDVSHSLTFNDNEDTFTWNTNRSRFARVRYEISAPPVATPRLIEIDLGKSLDSGDTIRLSGDVKRASGEGLARARVYLEARFPERNGTLVVLTQATANDAGQYQLETINAPRYSARIYDPGRSELVLEEKWQGTNRVDAVPRDFQVRE